MYTRIYVYICMYVGVHVCVSVLRSVFSVYLYLFMCTVACFSDSDPFGEIRTRCRRPEPNPFSCSSWTRYAGNPKTDHGMIRRSVPVRAVKIRRRFYSETASFHVSVPCFLLILFYMSAFNWFLYTLLCLNSIHV